MDANCSKTGRGAASGSQGDQVERTPRPSPHSGCIALAGYHLQRERSRDRIEFLAAEPIGVAAGASVRFYASHAVLHADGDMVIGERLEPLAGAIAEVDAGAPPGYMDTIGIVAEITPHQAGRFVMTSVRLRYRLNGGNEQTGEGIDVVFTVCADDPAPAECPE